MRLSATLLLAILIISCKKENNLVTNPEDYNAYLNTETSKTTSKYFELWNSKIQQDSSQLLSFGNVASEYTRYFKNTGNITFLKKAEQSLVKAVEIANIGKEAYARALARNYIAQHRFKEALLMTNIAKRIGGGKKETQALFFDVHMELGNYELAESYLDSIKNMADFGYLIRNAKWNDYQGNLDTTIRFMEMALEKAESSKNKSLLLWSYTNLADYYGHAGRIEDSYNSYLKALELDPQNAYAKKGIAWIVFSFEKNGHEALRILDSVTENYNSPDYYLLKAEIANFMDDRTAMNAHMDRYYAEVQENGYGDMYNGHNVDYYLEHTKKYDKALHLAFKEIKNRPTPESYNLLARTYLKMGEAKKALQIVEGKIMGKTYEPGILLNVAEIYKANHQYDKVNTLKRELAEAFYELGPLSAKEIEML